MFRSKQAADEKSGSASKRLSERFGIPEQEVNDLLYGRVKDAASQSLPKGELRMPMPERESNRWNPLSIVAALLGVVGILSLITLMMVVWHHHRSEMQFSNRDGSSELMQNSSPQSGVTQPDQSSMENIPNRNSPGPVIPMDSSSMNPDSTNSASVNSPSANNGNSSSEANSAPKKTVHHVVRGYHTTSDMDAEEHLAELRADGNTHAKIRSFKKGGVTTYVVR
ncbi:MAG TPA: hypothetical protein VEW28_07245 [Candidatus Kapabacteria bacterium]|nr:hypothetical protein [Candidatus Kapabacteria bacterium]